MCGIYGIYNYKKNGFDMADLKSMGDVLHMRGPDDSGSYVDEMVMLGHNRLSIIDLSPNGRQPISNEDGSVWLTGNGEIYNFKELRDRLKYPHQFKSRTDTEVLIHCYEEMGETLWDRLEGMFAFCLWDKKRHIFYLVRDHYGIKPLYYSQYNGSIIFASQIKGILAINSFTPSYNYQAISNFLSFFYVPGPETILKDIMQLPAGSFLRKTTNNTSITRYYKLKFNINTNPSKEKVIYEIPEKVKDAVRKSVVSDVPVGLLLSGGIDSNILLAEMSQIYPERIKTFTLGVNEPSYDESEYASEIAKKYKTIHHTDYFSLNDFDAMLTDTVRAVDCLNANPGLIMSYQFLRMASKHVKVVIAGSGGDELFAGYQTYLADAALNYFRFVPSSFKKTLLKISNHLPVSYKKYSYSYVLNRFLEGSFYDREKAHYWWRVIFTDEEKSNILSPQLINDEKLNIDASYKYIEKFNEIDESFENRALYADFYLFLIDNALTLLDHLSMHFSLEVRPLLLHQRFVDYSLTVPYYLKFRHGRTKYILRKAYEGILPTNVIKRKKHGVVVPLGIIFKNNLKAYVQDQLSPERLNAMGIFNTNYIQNIVDRHLRGLEDNGFKIWCMLCLLKWNDIFYRRRT